MGGINLNGNAGVIINTSPRPRMLIRGFDDRDRDELLPRLRELVPTARLISSLREVRQAEWDILVTNKSLSETTSVGTTIARAEPHLCVIYVSRTDLSSEAVEERPEWDGTIYLASRHICQELKRLKIASESVAALTHEQLEPVLTARDSHIYFRSSSRTTESAPQIEPFIATADGRILAGKYRRSEKSEAWLLPGDIPDIVPWVRVALAEWHHLAPDRFPGRPDWSQAEEWLSPAEQSLKKSLEDLDRKREVVLSRLADRERKLRQLLRQAKEAADAYERALLTTQSDELKAAVIKALTEIGFKVADADAEAKPDDHLEDLHIEDPDAPGWIALGEVKGYTKGAKTEALTQFIRFQGRYVQRTGKLPNALWYIVNQFLARDPSTRQPVLNGKDEDVAAFAEAGGLVIDTVILFKLLAQVRKGVITDREARHHLRSSTGRLTLPDTPIVLPRQTRSVVPDATNTQ